MTLLKIKKPGYTIVIPGMPPARSPVDINISKLDMKAVAMYLKSADITEYEIITSVKNVKKVYTQIDFDDKKEKNIDDHYNRKELNSRFNKLEDMLNVLLTKESGSYYLEKEQTINESDKIPLDSNEPDIEEIDFFIPDIDVSDLTLKSYNTKTEKIDSDKINDAANMLSNMNRKK